ncbi:acyl-CoA dehydratase activase [uncultured Eubacterium sp.]|uniref:acyl-CoA dehydratase activase n=1 Tax=uncultured Eubacterium sp. TaxID=165185 RepID=UPI0025F5EFCA|nr:acyl-CoA dehydratase activase [uncultured Eubacterium sp.]
MLAYFCKYVPEELMQAFGTELVCLEPHVTNFTQADALMHPNMCSFSKAVLEEFEKQDYEGMIFTSCCDSSRRLYDILCQQFPDKFFFCLDLPRKINDFAVTLYTKQLQKLIEVYAAFSGKTFSEQKLLEICKKRATSTNSLAANTPMHGIHIALVGARPGSEIRQLITDHQAEITLDLTCTGIQRSYDLDSDQILPAYARALLDQLPCMRMAAASNRQRILEAYEDRIDGIVYHTVKFCDIYAYEYTKLHETSSLPMLKIETDATAQCGGQILTRLEAFLESLRAQKGEAMLFINKRQQLENCPIETQDTISDTANKKTVNTPAAPVYVMGIDSGSTSTNAVILNGNREIIASAVIRTGAKSSESAQRILEGILQKANLQRSDLTKIVSTGYGRVSIPFADENVTEISCHGKGAHYLNPEIRTILDIGGQDSKAIHLNEKGDVTDFVMNDKCAAGTGRFLEMMARTLEVDISELGPLSLKSTENIEISSMCSVFAESEVISLIAQNKETSDIAHGIHMAIAAKAISLMRRVGLEPGYMMTGGVAKNPGVVKVLEEQLKAPLFISEEPEIVGALGAALYGLESVD